MKTLAVSFVCLFIMACTATKKCPPAVSYPFTNCITDSATINNLLVGTWDWIKQTKGNHDIYACETLGTLTYQFDSLGSYQFINNGNVLINSHYSLIQSSPTYLFDSAILNSSVSICNGYLFLVDQASTTEIYIRRN